MQTLDIRWTAGIIRVDVDTAANARTLARMTAASNDCEGVAIYEGEHRTHQFYRDHETGHIVQWQYVTDSFGKMLAFQTVYER